MAITSDVQKDIVSLVVGMFNAAPGQAVLEELAVASENGSSLTDLAKHLASTREFKSIYPTILTNEDFATRLVDNMVGGKVSAEDRQWAIDALTGSLNANVSRGEVALEAITALRAVESDNALWGNAATAFENKVDVATYYSIKLGGDADSLAELQAVLAGVDQTDASVEAAKEAADGSDTGGAGTFRLTADEDNLSGTLGNDLFIAKLSSTGGLQVNTLASGDTLNGGAGVDTLIAQVTQGATHGGSSMPIAPNTNSIEHVTLEAVNADQGASSGNTTVFVDAGTRADYPTEFGMTGLQSIGSAYSNANLVIQNLTTRTDAGGLRLPSDVTITMSHTGGNDTNWDESDLHVFFAANNLDPDVESTATPSKAFYWLADQDSDNFAGAPLQNIDRDGIGFTLDGVAYEIIPGAVALAANTWEEYAEALRDTLADLVAGGATALAGIEISVNSSNTRITYDSFGNAIAVQAIEVSDSNGGEFTVLGYNIPDGQVGDFNVFGSTGFEDPTIDTAAFVTSTIELEKVGRGADGGELVIGSMDKLSYNSFNGVQGVERFNVTVLGGENLPNSLSSLRSTNNQLQIVNIESNAQGASSFASLVIGNSNTAVDEYGLKDVRVVNAVDFNGDLSITAEITTESFTKYVDLFDAASNAAEDNVFFDYFLTGEGDNSLLLDVDMDLAAHEDFMLSVVTGSGDDSVTVRLDALNDATLNQYLNQSELENVSIATGAGDDVVRTPGTGNVTINAGAGNDTVYTDNVGRQTILEEIAPGVNRVVGDDFVATWLTNAGNTDITDILGAGAGTNYFVPNGKLTVTFTSAIGVSEGAAGSLDNGYESTVSIPTSNGYVANHLHINQAIKAAINADPVLNKLLVAIDGPTNSLIIESLIDGEYAANALSVTVANPTTTYTAGQLLQLNNAYKQFMGDSSVNLANSADANILVAGQLTTLGGAYQGINGSTQATITGNVDVVVGVDQIVKLDFNDLTDVDDGGSIVVSIVVNGTTYTASTAALAGGDDSDAVASAVASLTPGDFGLPAGAFTTGIVGGVVTFSFDQSAGAATVSVAADGTLTFDDMNDSPEVQTIDFTGLTVTGAGNIVVGGIAVAVLAGDDANDIAAAIQAVLHNNPLISGPATVNDVVVANVGGLITITYDAADGDVTPITVGGSAVLTGGTPVVTTTSNYQAVQTVDPSVVDVDVTQDFVLANLGGVGDAPLTGANSESLTDNVINLGTGQDVVVLSTSSEANETLVWTGYGNGNNTIVNFSEEGVSIDYIDFSAYLTTQTSASGSASSAVTAGSTVQLGAGSVNANEVVIVDFSTLVTGMTATALGTITWDSLSTANLQTILNAASSSWTRVVTTDQYSANKAVFMIEGANDGDYKVFDVSFTNTAPTPGSGFTVVGLIGQADFGDSLTSALTDANFV